MAWALVGTNGNNSSASSPLGITKTSGGSTLRIAILARTASNDVYTAVTDTGGNTWTKRADSGASGVGRRIEIWDSVNGAAITALSAAFTGAGTALGAVFEWSGHHATPFDAATALVRASSTTPAAATVTPSASSNLIIAGCMANPNTAAQTLPGGTWIPLTVHANGPACAYRTDPTSAFGPGPGSSWPATRWPRRPGRP